MRVERNIDGFTLPEPLLVPLQVGSFGAQSPGGDESEVLAMTATIDIDQLPGLRAAFEKHHAGTLLDITAQWHMAVPGDTTVAPLAFLHLEIEEFKLSFDIIFDVDEHQRSLAAAARTGKLTLFEPELGGALRIEAPQEALRRLMSLGVMTGDTEPLRRVLHQRFDLPFKNRPVPRQVVGPGEAPDSLDEFRDGASENPELAIVGSVGGPTVVMIVDPAVDLDALAESDPEARWAHWSAVVVGPHALVRVDVLDGKTPLGAWIWANPEQQLVRATSAGAHYVAVVTEEVSDDPGERRVQLGEAVVFLVNEAAPAMRALLR
jgi:hypothetical protein